MPFRRRACLLSSHRLGRTQTRSKPAIIWKQRHPSQVRKTCAGSPFSGNSLRRAWNRNVHVSLGVCVSVNVSVVGAVVIIVAPANSRRSSCSGSSCSRRYRDVPECFPERRRCVGHFVNVGDGIVTIGTSGSGLGERGGGVSDKPSYSRLRSGSRVPDLARPTASVARIASPAPCSVAYSDGQTGRGGAGRRSVATQCSIASPKAGQTSAQLQQNG